MNNIEEEIEKIKNISLEEIETKIVEHELRETKEAFKALNKIKWILKIGDKKSIKKIQDVYNEYEKISNQGLKLYILKLRKEQYLENPEVYKNRLIKMQELSKKYKEEDQANKNKKP